MNKNLKLLLSRTLIAASFLSVSYAVQGTENDTKFEERDQKRSYQAPFSENPLACIEGLEQHAANYLSNSSTAQSSLKVNPFENCPQEVKLHILEYATITNNYTLDNFTIDNLRKVCKDWYRTIKQNKDKIKQSLDSAIYHRFLKGKLIYKPNLDNDTGKIELPIKNLANPLEGMFDLSRCGDASKYLSISTGYRKGKKAENANKLEIWLTPRFLVEREINGNVQYFQAILPGIWSKTAPVGIFWTWGGWEMEWYDFVTNNTMDRLSSANLYDLGIAAASMGQPYSSDGTRRWPPANMYQHNRLLWLYDICNATRNFSFSFYEPK